MVIRRLLWAIVTPLSTQLVALSRKPKHPAPRYWVEHTRDDRFVVRPLRATRPPLTTLEAVVVADGRQAVDDARLQIATILNAADNPNGERP